MHFLDAFTYVLPKVYIGFKYYIYFSKVNLHALSDSLSVQNEIRRLGNRGRLYSILKKKATINLLSFKHKDIIHTALKQSL